MAQTPPVIHVQTREVDVEVTATDSKGNPVQDLQQQDFKVMDDGKPRVLDGFSVIHEYPPLSATPGASSPLRLPTNAADQSGAPRAGHSTAIILDEVNTYFEDAAVARKNVVNLMGKVPPDERIALYVIVRKQGLLLLQDYTTDRDQLKRSLAKHFPQGMRPVDDQPPHFYVDQPVPPNPFKPLMPVEYLAMWRENDRDARLSLQALADQLAATPGRKTVFWVTNGFHPWTLGLGKPPLPDSPEFALSMEKPAWEKTFTALNNANVAVNVVDSRGLYGASNPVTGTIAVMEEVAERTGGKAYYGRNDLDGAIAEGIAASRTTYTLRFHLGDDERDNKFHALNIKGDRPGLQLFYRQSYSTAGNVPHLDLVAGRIDGQALEASAAIADAGTLTAHAQLSWFYTGTNRANVLLAAETTPTGMAFQRDATGMHGKIEVVGIASRPDGAEAARFADTVNVDLDNQQAVDLFMKKPWHYEHQFTAAAGTYVFRVVIGAGPNAVGKVEIPLAIDPWNSANFGIGGIALSSEARAAGGGSELDAIDPEARAPLVALGKEFVPATTNRFQKSQPIYFYTEIYDPALKGANPVPITLQFRILDPKTGDVKLDSGVAAIANYMRPGNPVVPFATRIPVTQLPPGSYRLEVRAASSFRPGPRHPDGGLRTELALAGRPSPCDYKNRAQGVVR